MMLDRVEKYQQAFERLDEEDGSFRNFIGEVECPLTYEDWNKCRLFVRFLKLFYDATLRFSGSKHITYNAFFIELVLIQETIEREVKGRDLMLRSMAENMKSKFAKYWGNGVTFMNKLLCFAMVLDPRWKIRYIKFYFVSSDPLTKKVEDTQHRIFEVYVANEEGVDR